MSLMLLLLLILSPLNLFAIFWSAAVFDVVVSSFFDALQLLVLVADAANVVDDADVVGVADIVDTIEPVSKIFVAILLFLLLSLLLFQGFLWHFCCPCGS